MVSDKTYNNLYKKKQIIEKESGESFSFDGVINILMKNDKKIMFVPKRKYILHKERAELDELYPIIHL